MLESRFPMLVQRIAGTEAEPPILPVMGGSSRIAAGAGLVDSGDSALVVAVDGERLGRV